MHNRATQDLNIYQIKTAKERSGVFATEAGVSMNIRIPKRTPDSFTRNVSFMFVVYWGILVFWQNVSGAETRGTMDLLIKVGLMIYFVGFYLLRARTFNIKGLPVLLLAISLLITASTESTFSLGNLVSYAYPVIILFVVYGFGDNLQINREQLLAFCKCVIGITLYAAIYAVIFCWDQFAGALSLNSAYGNELSSFFISNHEYGMYLVAAIVACILCLNLSKGLDTIRKMCYLAIIAFLAVNLILTFSRTSMLGLAVFLFVYVLWGKKTARKWLVSLAVVLVVVIAAFPRLTEFVWNIVFKGNNAADRDVLLEQGVRYYNNGEIIQKLFGHGIYETQNYFEKHFEHSSVHNAYLQVLLYYGLAGLGMLIVFLLSQLVGGIRFYKKDRYMGAVFVGLLLSAMAMMFTNTAIIFTSPIDSFFLTVFFVLIPKYVRNSILQEKF